MRWSGHAGKRRVRGPVVAALLGLTLAGCGAGESPANQAADRQFVQSVKTSAPDVNEYRNDTQLIRLGRAACAGFDSGVSYEQLADRLALREGAKPLPSQDLGAVITSAVNTYCPKFANLVN